MCRRWRPQGRIMEGAWRSYARFLGAGSDGDRSSACGRCCLCAESLRLSRGMGQAEGCIRTLDRTIDIEHGSGDTGHT